MVRRCFSPEWPLALFFFVTPAYCAESNVDPGDTFAVIVGVLEWKDPALSSFPKENRKDEQLHAALVELGVPKENMVLLLDEKATLAGIYSAIETTSKRAGEGATFVFYYAGHGTKTGGRSYLCNYDYVSGQASRSGFDVALITAAIKRNFRGQRVFLLGDCCYSGSLAHVASDLGDAGYKSLALTSARASNVSTSNWTFTQTVIDAIKGDPMVDENDDGVIQVAEAAWAVKEAMQHCERQFFGYAIHNLSTRFPIAETNGKQPKHKKIPQPYSFGQYVYAMPRSTWQRGRVMNYKKGQFAVRMQYYSERPTVWLPVEKVKPIEFDTFAVGANLTVIWKKREYKATVEEVRDKFHYITYPGYSKDWNEWVLSNRIVGVYEEIARKPRVQIKWGNQWFNGIVLRTEDERHLVHYTGYDTSDDEWVTADRLRAPR
jgi:hypothetical protein